MSADTRATTSTRLVALRRGSLVSGMSGKHTDYTIHCSVQAQVDSFWARIDANEAAYLAESQMPAIPEDSGKRNFLTHCRLENLIFRA